MREPFILYRRPDGARGGKGFNVAFWDKDQKKYISRRSVAALVDEIRGTLPAGTSPITKAGARRIVELWLEDHSPAPVRGQTLTLQAYLKSFWADEGQYATNLRARGRTISLEYLSNNRRNLNNHVLPWLTRQANNIVLQDFTAGQLEELIMHLHKHGTVKTGTRDGKQIDTGKLLTARTINAIRQAVSVPLAEAFRLGLIRENPASKSPKLAEHKTERGVLSLAEARKVLSQKWDDQRAFAASLLAATTGMRLGEVRGLKLDAIHDEEVEIRQSWSNLEGGKDPKWRSIRTVPIPAHVASILRSTAETSPWDTGFVFYSLRRRTGPIDNATIQKGLKAALLAAGILSDRGVTFHSWRHFYNSQMRDHIPDHALRQLTGHKSEQMTDRYTHITEETRLAAGKLAEQILDTAAKV